MESNTHRGRLSVSQGAERVSALVKSKELSKSLREGSLREILSTLSAGLSSEESRERAVSLASLGKIASVVRRRLPELVSAFESLSDDFRVDMLQLDSADDRYYAATFWRFATPTWTTEELARGAVLEESAENFRRECCEGLCKTTPSLAAALKQLTPPVKSLRFTTESPGDSKAKRLRRLLEALREAIAIQKPEPGEDVGAEFRDLILTSFHNQAPQKAAEELADECLLLIHDVIRLKFTLATIPVTYAAAGTVKQWLSKPDWEAFVENHVSAASLASDVEGAIEVLARAGIADSMLFEWLAVLAGSLHEARERAVVIAARNPSLGAEVTDWLHGRSSKKRVTTLATSSIFQQADELIADLLIQQNILGFAHAQIDNDVLPRLKVLDEQTATIVEAWKTKAQAIETTIQILADLRGLKVVGTVGDNVEYSPTEHQLTDATDFGARLVRIIRPAVVAETDGDRRRIVRKALVEPY